MPAPLPDWLAFTMWDGQAIVLWRESIIGVHDSPRTHGISMGIGTEWRYCHVALSGGGGVWLREAYESVKTRIGAD